MVNQEVAMGNQGVAMVNLDGKQKEDDDLQKGKSLFLFFTYSWFSCTKYCVDDWLVGIICSYQLILDKFSL